ncbi:hypothetical protein JKY72_02555 [Candidatus Gracilibacteria bacterium]|nr:hypothetical protein [Candidatus Gracilibacteria bacterium]
MAVGPGKNIESGPEIKSTPKHKVNPDSREVRDAAEGFSGAVESMSGVEDAESAESMGNVSENANEGRERKGDAVKGGKAKKDAKAVVAQIKSGLLKNIPSETLMKKAIEKEIRKEIDYLHSKAMKMVRSPRSTNYFELNNTLKKIRELKRILSKLLKASIEKVKTLWLRYVHGIM